MLLLYFKTSVTLILGRHPILCLLHVAGMVRWWFWVGRSPTRHSISEGDGHSTVIKGPQISSGMGNPQCSRPRGGGLKQQPSFQHSLLACLSQWTKGAGGRSSTHSKGGKCLNTLNQDVTQTARGCLYAKLLLHSFLGASCSVGTAGKPDRSSGDGLRGGSSY